MGLMCAALLAIAGCDGDSRSGGIVVPPPGNHPVFAARGLAGHTVLAFAQTDTAVLAGTRRGIYRYDGDIDWTLITPEAWSVIAMESLYPSHLLASVEIDSETRYVVESLNGGETWDIIDHDFGGDPGQQQREPVFRMSFADGSGDLFGTGYGVLARSADFGRNWKILAGSWGIIGTGLSALSRAALRGDIWYGGQGALEDPVLIRYAGQTGETADLSAAIEALLPRPSTVENIRFYPGSESTVFVTGEGGVVRSSDYGNSWQPSLVNDRSRFYFDLIVDEQTGAIYTGGWDKNFSDPQPLILEVSTDSGTTWSAYEHPDRALQGGIWSMRLVDLDNRRRLFLGLQGGGVYEADLDAVD